MGSRPSDADDTAASFAAREDELAAAQGEAPLGDWDEDELESAEGGDSAGGGTPRPAADAEAPAAGPQVFIVPESLAGQRADKVLAVACPEFSRERLQGLFAEDGVLLNGRPIAKKVRLAADDAIHFTPPLPLQTSVHPVAMPLQILFEDEAVAAVNKPVGLVVHPGAGVVDEATLVHGMLHHCAGQLAGAGGVLRPGIVHRLDRDTSGVIVLAKTDAAYYALVRAFAERNTRKIYWALVRRGPREDSGTIQLPIGRHPSARHKMAVREDGRNAHTDWQVVERFANGAALVQCRIHTGRTHQIRVHLSQMGSPIWGDKTYGYRPEPREAKVPEQFLLHARELELPHPITGKPLLLQAEPSQHFADHLAWLRALPAR